MYLPTQREIRQACAEIRAGWAPDEFYRRRQGWDPDLTLTAAELDARPTEAPLIQLDEPTSTPAPQRPQHPPHPAPSSATPATARNRPATPAPTGNTPQHRLQNQHEPFFFIGVLAMNVQIGLGHIGFSPAQTTRVSASDPLVRAILQSPNAQNRAQLVELLRDKMADEITRLALENAADHLLADGLSVGEVIHIP